MGDLLYHLDCSVVQHTLGKSVRVWGRYAFQCVCVCLHCACILVTTTLSVILLPVELRNCRLEEACRCIVQSWSQDKGTKE